MDDKFLVGVVVGMVGGAVIAANSAKARQAIKSGQEQVKEKVESMTQKAGSSKNK